MVVTHEVRSDLHNAHDALSPSSLQLVTPDDLLATLEWMPNEAVESLTPTVLEGWPNTYTYSKQMAEHFVEREVRRRGMSLLGLRTIFEKGYLYLSSHIEVKKRYSEVFYMPPTCIIAGDSDGPAVLHRPTKCRDGHSRRASAGVDR